MSNNPLMDARSVGERYRARRESLGLSQARVAQLAHVTVGVLSRLERGIGRRAPHNLALLGEAVGWAPDWWQKLTTGGTPTPLLTSDTQPTDSTSLSGMSVEVRVRGVHDPELTKEAEREAYRAAAEVIIERSRAVCSAG